MQNWLTDLTALVASNGGGTVGVNLFAGQIPSSYDPASLATLLFPTGGGAPDPAGLEFCNLQITHRCRTFATAWAEAWRLYGLLRNYGPVRLGTSPNYTLLQEMKSLGPPFALGLDETQSWRVVTNYELELLAF